MPPLLSFTTTATTCWPFENFVVSIENEGEAAVSRVSAKREIPSTSQVVFLLWLAAAPVMVGVAETVPVHGAVTAVPVATDIAGADEIGHVLAIEKFWVAVANVFPRTSFSMAVRT